jgi:glycogen operon protein
VLGPVSREQGPIFVVLNAAPEEIAFRLPVMSEYRTWRQVLNTTEATQTSADFASGAEAKAPSRSVLAFAGIA